MTFFSFDATFLYETNVVRFRNAIILLRVSQVSRHSCICCSAQQRSVGSTNARKYLQKLNQCEVYTTHMPFMLDYGDGSITYEFALRTKAGVPQYLPRITTPWTGTDNRIPITGRVDP